LRNLSINISEKFVENDSNFSLKNINEIDERLQFEKLQTNKPRYSNQYLPDGFNGQKLGHCSLNNED
jgi:hypothetical protein